MSFSFSTTAARPDVADSVANIGGAYDLTGNDAPTETRALIDAAPAIAQAAADAIGRPEDHVDVSVSGHANLGNGRRDGFANEHLAVSVSVSGGPVD